jgi:hypothetical protein
MSLEARIDSVGRHIQLLARRLAERGFQFERPDAVLPGPENGAAEAIERIEVGVGALPQSLKLLWQRVGSVDLCGGHPEWELQGECCPGPLAVHPPSFAIEELEEFIADKAERLKRSFPYVVPISPDCYHKAGVSGGMFYNISVPAVADDPPLNDEWHNCTLVTYLEFAVKWAGFPGLERCPIHTWPIAELVEGI